MASVKACRDAEVAVNGRRMTREAFESMFFPAYPMQLSWSALNPSMTLVFLCQVSVYGDCGEMGAVMG